MITMHLIPARRDNYIFALTRKDKEGALVIDPADSAPVIDWCEARGLRVDEIWCTHHHHDHIGGNGVLQARYGCLITGYGPDAARIPGIGRQVEDGETLHWDDARAEVLFVPGHTLGHIAYHLPEEGVLLCGDTLFAMGCGRLFEGTPQQMHHSLGRLASLPPETRVYCAHEYTEANGAFALSVEPENEALQARMKEVRALRREGRATIPTTLAAEKATNPFLRPGSPEIRARLGMEEESDEVVFARLRQMKDEF